MYLLQPEVFFRFTGGCDHSLQFVELCWDPFEGMNEWINKHLFYLETISQEFSTRIVPSCLPPGVCLLFSGSVHSHLGYPRPTQLDALSWRGALIWHQRDQLEPERALPAVRRWRRNSQSVGPATVQGANFQPSPRKGLQLKAQGKAFNPPLSK